MRRGIDWLFVWCPLTWDVLICTRLLWKRVQEVLFDGTAAEADFICCFSLRANLGGGVKRTEKNERTEQSCYFESIKSKQAPATELLKVTPAHFGHKDAWGHGSHFKAVGVS